MIKRGLESKIKKFEKRRESESSLSEDSIPTSPKSARLFKKISSPDIRTSGRYFKPLDKSYSVDEVVDDNRRAEGPTPPPRPHRAEMSRLLQLPSIPKITEDLLSDSPSASGPNRPVRPRGSEIRRAKDRSRGNRTDFDGDTDASSVFSPNSKSSSEMSSSKPHHRKVQKKMSTVEMSSSKSLLPPPVPRRKSTSDVDVEEAGAPPISAPPQRLPTDTAPAANPLSQQMADTLIKYILSSEDPGLKNALRQIITNDPHVMQAIQSDTAAEKQGGLPPTPPKRPY